VTPPPSVSIEEEKEVAAAAPPLVEQQVAAAAPSPVPAPAAAPPAAPAPEAAAPPRKVAHPVEEARSYVVEPPATGGGEPGGPIEEELLDPEYRIGVEDLLEVSLLGEPDLQRVAMRVSPRGTVDFPYAGTVPAAGLTVDEFRRGLLEKLDAYYVAPQVTVFLREYRSRMVHILGEVPRPGPFKLTHRNTLMEVLSRAGGFTPLADKSDVQVIRQDAAGKRIIKVNVNAIIDDGRIDLDLPLESGDVINVPERFF
jgi:polysaccharide export outer membrane protein